MTRTQTFLHAIALSLLMAAPVAECNPLPAAEEVPLVTATVPAGVSVSEHGLREAVITWVRPAFVKCEYVIERSESEEGPFTEVARTSAKREKYTDAPLADNTSYLYRIKAVTKEGLETEFSKTVTTTTAPLPVPPSSIRATHNDLVRSIEVTWNLPDETRYVSGYRVERSESEEGPFTLVKTLSGVDSLQYMNGGKEPGNLKEDHVYFYRVSTVNEADAVSEPSGLAKGKTRAIPPVVTGVTSESGHAREVPVRWDISPDEKVAGYFLLRQSLDGNFGRHRNIKGRESTSWSDQGNVHFSGKLGILEDATTYRYKVVAYNIGKTEAPPSEATSATTKSRPGKPATPFSRSDLVGSVDLYWSASPEPDLDYYRIETSPSAIGGFRTCGKSKKPAFRHNGLKAGVEHFYRVVAVDEDTLESDPSELASAVTRPVPDQPYGLDAIETDHGGFALSWDRALDIGVTSYVIYRKTLFSKKEIGRSETTGFELTPDMVGKKIRILVSAVNAAGQESIPSKVLHLVPTPVEK